MTQDDEGTMDVLVEYLSGLPSIKRLVEEGKHHLMTPEEFHRLAIRCFAEELPEADLAD
jgi:hypothetical protein